MVVVVRRWELRVALRPVSFSCFRGFVAETGGRQWVIA